MKTQRFPSFSEFQDRSKLLFSYITSLRKLLIIWKLFKVKGYALSFYKVLEVLQNFTCMDHELAMFLKTSIRVRKKIKKLVSDV